MRQAKNLPGGRGRRTPEPTRVVTSPSLAPKERPDSDARPKRERLLTEDEVAEWLGISPLTLRKWRCLRTHELPFVKIGKTIRYRESDVLRFLESHMVVPTTVETSLAGENRYSHA